MDLQLHIALAEGYKSKSQAVRVITESWLAANMYCPNCGDVIASYENNRPVADFYCKRCRGDFELKSKKGTLGRKILAGAYSSMIERITSDNIPNFFFLTYKNWMVNNLLFIPNAYFLPSIIEKRKPLPATAKRAGWVGCNIDISGIPEAGRVSIVKQGCVMGREAVVAASKSARRLAVDSLEMRGWLFDVMLCLDRITSNIFTLSDIYRFEEELRLKHPDNRFIKDKIRQQLQLLRDKGFIEFISRGVYRKI